MIQTADFVGYAIRFNALICTINIYRVGKSKYVHLISMTMMSDLVDPEYGKPFSQESRQETSPSISHKKICSLLRCIHQDGPKACPIIGTLVVAVIPWLFGMVLVLEERERH